MAHALTYDTLPPHSNLRREVSDRVIKITAASEEPSPHARRAELQRAAFSSALLTGALLLAFILAIGSTYLAHRRYIGWWLFLVLLVAFVAFCAALFLFIWRVRYAARIDALEKALRQTTILAASPGRLLIETAGPFGQESHDLTTRTGGPYRIVDFRRGQLNSHPCLEIVLASGHAVRVLPGRDEVELQWVARTLLGTIGIGS